MAQETDIQTLLGRFQNDPWHAGVAVSTFDTMTGQSGHYGSGDLDPGKPYFTNGVTKLYVAAIIIRPVSHHIN